MPSGPRIQNWQVLRPVAKVGRLNKYIDVPPFSEQCFRPNVSLDVTALQAAYITPNVNYSGHAGFTFECWIKNVSPISSQEQTICRNHRSIENDDQWKLCLMDSKLVFTWLDATSLTEVSVTSIDLLPHGEWCHVGVSWSSAGVILYINGQVSTRFYGDGTDFYVDGLFVTNIEDGVDLYVDGVQVLASQTLAMAQAVNSVYLFSIGSSSLTPPTALYVGYIAEMRYWSTVQTDENILYKYNKPRNKTAADGVDDELTWYFSMTDYDSVYIYEDIARSSKITLFLSTVLISTEEYPPLVYGASFVPLVFHVVGGKEHSLKYPVGGLNSLNCALVVAWEDEDGTYQRRHLNLPNGVDINPPTLEYQGERLPADYDLEVWNIDGQDDVTSTATIRLTTSVSLPRTSPDNSTQTALTTLTEDTTLAQPFPLVFPLTFNTQQTY